MRGRARRREIVGGVASIPWRAAMLEQMVASVLPQLDRLAVYLNGYDEVPAFLGDPKITVHRSQDHGDRGDAGKFFAVEDVSRGVFFSLDDDIIYPRDYCAHMTAQLDRLGRRAVLGVHGVVYNRRPISFFDRRVLQFPEANDRLRLVSLVGTGTACFSVGDVPVSRDVFRTGSMADLWFGAHVKRLGIPVVCVDRAADWMRAIPPTRGDSLWRVATSSSGPHERLVRSAGPWGRGDLVARAEAAGLPGVAVPGWMRIPDLVDVLEPDQPGAGPGEWPGAAVDWSEPRIALYFDEWEHLELVQADARERRSLEKLGPALMTAAGASLSDAIACAEAAIDAVPPGDVRSRPVLTTVALQLLRRAEQPHRAVELYHRLPTSTQNVERERALALLDDARPAEAARAVAFSPWAAPLDRLAAVARALACGRDEDVLRAAVGVAADPTAWYLRRGLAEWVRDRPEPGDGSAAIVDAGWMEAEGARDGFDHVGFLRVLQALGAADLSRFWLHRFGHRVSGGADQLSVAMLLAQLQPSAAEAGERLNALWRRAGLAEAGPPADGSDATPWPSPSLWAARSFGPSPVVDAPALVSVAIPVGDHDGVDDVAAAVASATGQRVHPLEVVVVGPSAALAALGEPSDPGAPVRLVESAAGVSRSARRNLGVARSAGRYLAVHDVGDRAHPQRLGHQLQLMAETRTRACVAPCFRVDARGEPRADVARPPLGDVAGTLVIERALLDEVGGFDEARDAGDGGDEEMLDRLEHVVGYAAIGRVQVPLVVGRRRGPKPDELVARGAYRRAHYFGARPPAPAVS